MVDRDPFLFMISNAVIKLCSDVAEASGRALLVGGWVRDYLRGLETVDYDIEVHGVEALKLRELLDRQGHVDAVGEAFTVYKLLLRDDRKRFVVDVSLPRRESKTGHGHRGFVVEGDPWMSLEEAARRRDFTINAMMYDPLTREYLDPFHGKEDLDRGLIRVVDPETFVEDSLRVLRAMQFASRFAFDIDPATIDLCRRIDLSDLPAERIWAEVEKWLLQSQRPSIGLHAARELSIIEKLWPELHSSIESDADAFDRMGLRLDAAHRSVDGLKRPKQTAVMLAAFCYDLSPENADDILAKLKIFTFDHYDARSQVISLINHRSIPQSWHKKILAGVEVTDGDFRRLALRVEPALLYLLSKADSLSRGDDAVADEWFIERVRELGVEERAPEPILKGRHVLELGLEPGRRIGEITKAVYEKQLDGEVVTVDDAIDAARNLV